MWYFLQEKQQHSRCWEHIANQDPCPIMASPQPQRQWLNEIKVEIIDGWGSFMVNITPTKLENHIQIQLLKGNGKTAWSVI